MKIRLQDEEFEVENGMRICDAFTIPSNVIAAVYNNEVASLKHVIHKDGEISFITRTNRDRKDYLYKRAFVYYE